MNNIEQNALRIAELMGYKINSYDSRLYMKDSFCYGNIELIAKFNNYNGLMPIVFECNSSENFYMDIQYGKIFITKLIDIDDVEIIRYDYNTKTIRSETHFIEAIQECVIKYLELKND